MEGLIHQIISGIATGGIYASVSLALVMIYQATHHINFAQGEMATFSTYITLTFINMGMPYWAAFFLAVAVSFGIGVSIERILIRPMANAPILSAVGVFVGLLLIINSLSGWFFDYTIKQFPSPFPDKALLGGFISGHQLGSTGVTLAVLIAVYLFFRHTSLRIHKPLRVLRNRLQPCIRRGRRRKKHRRKLVRMHRLEILSGLFDDHVRQQNAIRASVRSLRTEILHAHRAPQDSDS